MIPSHTDKGFGNRNLLADLIEYIYSGTDCKLILIGDTAQLPPIHLEISPALNETILENDFNKQVITKELTQVVRQKQDSLILKNATHIRNIISKQNFKYPKMSCNEDVKRIVGGDELQEEIEKSYKIYGVEDTIVICKSNKNRKCSLLLFVAQASLCCSLLFLLFFIFSYYLAAVCFSVLLLLFFASLRLCLFLFLFLFAAFCCFWLCFSFCSLCFSLLLFVFVCFSFFYISLFEDKARENFEQNPFHFSGKSPTKSISFQKSNRFRGGFSLKLQTPRPEMRHTRRRSIFYKNNAPHAKEKLKKRPWAPLRAPFGCSWGAPGCSWGALGRSWQSSLFLIIFLIDF